MINLGLTQIQPEYNYHLRWQAGCRLGTSHGYNLDYFNSNHTTTLVEDGDRECFSYDGGQVTEEPGATTWGGITLDRARAGQPAGQHKFITGFYDPARDVIEGFETYTAPDCRSALQIDPLGEFVTYMDSLLRVDHKSFSDTPQSATCQFNYTISWRIELPKQTP
jgi:hypothetical protein